MPSTTNSTSAEDIICAVCQSGASPESDPILLCDGPADGFPCSVAVHLSCYSVPLDALSRDEWRCDPCDYYYGGGGAGRVCCYVCTRDEAAGVLKRTEADAWRHVNCVDDSTANPLAPAVPEPAGARRRLRKMGDPSEPEPAAAPGKRPPRDGPSDKSKRLRRPLGDVPINDGSRPPAEPASESASTNRRKRRRAVAASTGHRSSSKAMRFLDLEAAIGSDDDVEGDGEEEDDLSAIESEEAFLSSFINDSSQLGGYSQEDDLDRADPDAHAGGAGAGAGAGGESPRNNDATLHRTLDMDRERRLAFATPALTRRQHRRNRLRSNRESLATLSSSATTATPASAPSSIKGLGRMHFVRSVLEHHRRGGDADDVEALYRNLERQGRRGDPEEDEDAGGSQEDWNANGEGDIEHGGVEDDDDDHHESDDNDADEDGAALRRPVRPPPVLTVAVPYVDSGGSSSEDDCET
jgi:PHD-finger